MKMTIKKSGLILAIMTCFLVGISSGGFVTAPIETNLPADYEPFWFGPNTEPFNLYEPFNFNSNIGWFDSYDGPNSNSSSTADFSWFGYDMSEILYPNQAAVFQWETEPIINPQPESISKEELFKSKPIITPPKPLISLEKQSITSKLASEGGIFF
jgi:hypothetical protein